MLYLFLALLNPNHDLSIECKTKYTASEIKIISFSIRNTTTDTIIVSSIINNSTNIILNGKSFSVYDQNNPNPEYFIPTMIIPPNETAVFPFNLTRLLNSVNPSINKNIPLYYLKIFDPYFYGNCLIEGKIYTISKGEYCSTLNKMGFTDKSNISLQEIFKTCGILYNKFFEIENYNYRELIFKTDFTIIKGEEDNNRDYYNLIKKISYIDYKLVQNKEQLRVKFEEIVSDYLEIVNKQGSNLFTDRLLFDIIDSGMHYVILNQKLKDGIIKEFKKGIKYKKDNIADYLYRTSKLVEVNKRNEINILILESLKPKNEQYELKQYK